MFIRVSTLGKLFKTEVKSKEQSAEQLERWNSLAETPTGNFYSWSYQKVDKIKEVEDKPETVFVRTNGNHKPTPVK